MKFLEKFILFLIGVGGSVRWKLTSELVKLHAQRNDMSVVSQILLNARLSQVQPLLRQLGTRLGQGCYVETHLQIQNARKDYSNLVIGDNVYIGRDVFLDLSDKIKIEKDCTIAMRVNILTHFNAAHSKASRYFPTGSAPVIIRAGSYIGADAIIMPGVIIGEGAVVAAGAVVNQDVVGGDVVGGIPSKVISSLRDRKS